MRHNIFKSLIRAYKTRKKYSGAIGIIGGSDGPTAVYWTEKCNQDEFLEYASEQIEPCYRSFEELGNHLISKYGAVPYELLPREIENIKVNVVLSKHKHLIKSPLPPPENPSKKDIETYFRNDTTLEQAKAYPIEKLDLNIKAYRMKDIIVKIETKSGYLSLDNGNMDLFMELIKFQGVTQEDIINKTPRFMDYAHMMRKSGKLQWRGKDAEIDQTTEIKKG